MHLQQTKAESLASGGPQYYLHDLDAPIREFLRRRGACPVVLMTPYGIAPSPFVAVDRDHKIGKDGRVCAGRVGHDRIQRADGGASIGEAIRDWYGLPQDADFERVDVEATLHKAGHFILTPISATFRGRKRTIEIERPERPLSFNRRTVSSLWRDQLDSVRRNNPDDWVWACGEIARVVADHRAAGLGRIHEADLQRTSGALGILGVRLGPYLVTGYDCASQFRFLRFPSYACPVEIKKQSKGFRYQMERYSPLPRAVILCIDHNLVHVPADIDVVELSFFVELCGGEGAQ